MIIPFDKKKLSEKDLINTSLLVLAKAQSQGYETVTTSQLKEILRVTLDLSEEDKAPLANRVDTKFDQIVRNLVSHNVLENLGYAKRHNKLNNDEGKAGYEINNSGKAYLLSLFAEQMRTPNPLLTAAEQIAVKKEITQNPKYGENDLIESTLLTLVQGEKKGFKQLTTKQIKASLEDLLPMSQEDLEPLKGRVDNKFSQIVRNFTSHNTLEKAGFAKRYTAVNNESGLEGYQITNKGRNELLKVFLSYFPEVNLETTAKVTEKQKLKI